MVGSSPSAVLFLTLLVDTSLRSATLYRSEHVVVGMPPKATHKNRKAEAQAPAVPEQEGQNFELAHKSGAPSRSAEPLDNSQTLDTSQTSIHMASTSRMMDRPEVPQSTAVDGLEHITALFTEFNSRFATLEARFDSLTASRISPAPADRSQNSPRARPGSRQLPLTPVRNQMGPPHLSPAPAPYPAFTAAPTAAPPGAQPPRQAPAFPPAAGVPTYAHTRPATTWSAPSAHPAGPLPGASAAPQPAVNPYADQRLLDLGYAVDDATPTGSKSLSKSGRVKTSDDRITRDVDWPHFHVHTITNGTSTPAEYEKLSMAQFFQGFALSLKKEQDPTIREHMLDHMANLGEDASTSPWPVVRACHALILQKMELGLLDWSDQAKMEKIRNKCTTGSLKAALVQTKPCPQFQNGKCQAQGDHEDNGQTYRHICAFCYRTGGKYPHAMRDCKKAASNRQGPKNGEQPRV